MSNTVILSLFIIVLGSAMIFVNHKTNIFSFSFLSLILGVSFVSGGTYQLFHKKHIGEAGTFERLEAGVVYQMISVPSDHVLVKKKSEKKGVEILFLKKPEKEFSNPEFFIVDTGKNIVPLQPN